MEKRFRVLRIIGTLWKVVAWVTLIGGSLFALGLLLMGLLGSGSFILRLLGQESAIVPGAMGVVSSVVSFVVALTATIVYFLALYAVGDVINLLLAIEENTRQTMQSLRQHTRTEKEQPVPPPPSA
jgi:hypothetical protein